ncbi:MAG: 50S ribosomal protein L30 [Bdellovibrionaceae bacterium]|nr:50S ribosomal protein L30 [Pseudobdellovibrionaceae bacterium]
MNKYQVTLTRSSIGCSDTQIRTLKALGLKKINQTKMFNDSEAFRGQVRKVQHLITIKKEK